MRPIQLFFCCLLPFMGYSQCPEKDILLENQYQVDIFAQNYPNCEKFNYGLSLGLWHKEATIYDFSNMPPIKEIVSLSIGDLTFAQNLDFLLNVESVDRLILENNDNLESLSFLKNALVSKEVSLNNNSNLINIADLKIDTESIESVKITYNSNLELCDLNVFCELIPKDDIYFEIASNGNSDCRDLFQIAENCNSEFPIVQNVTYFAYDQGDIDSLHIRLPDVRTIHSFIIDGKNESDISSLEPLNFLDTINSMNIYNCPNLTSLSGLDSLSNISLNISNCLNLQSLSSINSFHSLKNLHLISCPKLDDLSDIDFKRIGIYNLTLRDLPILNQKLLNIDSIIYNIEVADLNWNDLSPLSNLVEAHNIDILSMPNLNSIEGLENLKLLFRLRFSGQPSLTEFSGLNKLTKISNLDIIGCQNLERIEDSFQSLDSIKGNLRISNHENIKSIRNFDKLNHVNSIYLAFNPELENIEFLDKSINIGSQISITNNKKLGNCNVIGICENILNGQISISGNLSDCENDEIAFISCGYQLMNPKFDIELTSQIEVDSFSQLYPQADSILASLTLRNISQDFPITDLSYFQQIKFIQGGLTLDNLSNDSTYSVFSEIEFDELSISNSDIEILPNLGVRDSLKSLTFHNCNNLKSIESLIGLKHIEERLRINKCDSLISLFGLDSLKRLNNLELWSCRIGDISALKNLKTIEKLGMSMAYGFGSLEVLSSLQEIGQLNIVQGGLEFLFPKNQITSLNGLSINNARFLKNISGFERIKDLENLLLRDDNYDEISGFDSLQTVYSPSNALWNSRLLIEKSNANSIRFPQLKKVKTLEFNSYGLKDNAFFENLDSIDNFIIQNNNNIERLDIFKDSISINSISIRNNINLSLCNTTWLCNFLYSDNDPQIKNNSDCNSISDLAYSCGYNVRCPSGDISILNDQDLSQYLDRYESCKVLPAGLELDMNTISGTITLDSLIGIGGLFSVQGHDGMGITPNLSKVNSAEFIGMKEDFQKFYNFEELNDLNISLTNDLDFLHVSIPKIRDFTFVDNENIQHLSFDEDVEGLSRFIVFDNPELKQITGPNISNKSLLFRLGRNETLEEFNGFENTSVSENGSIYLYENPKLNDCSIPPLCHIIVGDVKIYSNGELCSQIDTINLVCDGVLSNTKNLEVLENDIIIFPNPTNGSVNFQETHTGNTEFSGMVYDLYGEHIMKFTNATQISLEGIESGLYLIRFSDGNLFKIIKSH